ncbi:MAG: hypothetical protein WCL70_01425 [Paludibacter sp.]
MKVYAEFIEENGIEYRTKTILKFGDSWDLIGSIVMKNPGSAYPLNKIDKDEWECLRVNYNLKDVDETNWFLFKPDSTMWQIEKIFNGSYLNTQIKLNGIIQVFNLFNIREQNISTAIKLADKNESTFLFPYVNEVITLFQNKPVYLGWRWVYLNINKQFAEKVFEYVRESKYMYLEKDMIDNHFYHPGYISTAYKQELVQKPLKSFFEFFEI